MLRRIALFVLILATACSPTATSVSTPTLLPPSPTAPRATATPLPSPRPVTFTTADGVSLNGTLFGQGQVAIIFSNMGDQRQDSWTASAQALAEQGYLTLTYDFRYWVKGEMDTRLMKFVADDLSAAVVLVREQGAQKIVLVGASLGGMATAKAAAQAKASAVVILASPLNAPSLGLVVEAAELQAISAPKLFITSEDDQTVEASALKAMYALAVEPKELYVYPGTAHGTDLFKTANGPDLQARLLTFIASHTAASGAELEIDQTATAEQATQTHLCCTATPPPTPTSLPLFTVYDVEPIVPNGVSGAWDDRFTDPGAVVFHDGQFHMFRNGFRDWPASVQIGYVTSPDGYTWTKQGDDPVLKTADVSYAGVAALASSVIVEADGTWVLYFYTWQSKNSPSAGGIGRATAPAPTGPWMVDAELVLTPGQASEWDGSHVLAPDVIQTATGYVMYYSGYNRTSRQMIGLATSSDGRQWTKYDDPATTTAPFAESDPVLQPGETGAWDTGTVHQPRVFETAQGWGMIYRGLRGATGNDSLKMALGYAISPNGLHWQRSPLNPILTPTVVKGARYFWFTTLARRDDTLFLFLEIDKNQSTEIYLTTHLGPLP